MIGSGGVETGSNAPVSFDTPAAAAVLVSSGMVSQVATGAAIMAPSAMRSAQ